MTVYTFRNRSVAEVALVQGLACALGHAVADGPVGFVVLELQLGLVAVVAVQNACLAYPFYVACAADVEVAGLLLVPVIGVAVHFLLEGQSLLDFYGVARKQAYFLLDIDLDSVDCELIGYFAFHHHVVLGADFLYVRQQGLEGRHWGQFYHIFVEFVAGQGYMHLRGLLYDLRGQHRVGYFLHDVAVDLLYDGRMVSNNRRLQQRLSLFRLFLQVVQGYQKFTVLQQCLLTRLYYFLALIALYLLDRRQQLLNLLVLELNPIDRVRGEDLLNILFGLLGLLLIDYLPDRVEVIVLEHIGLELLQFLVTEGAAMVAIDGLLDAAPAEHMPTSGDVGIVDGIQADRALELSLEAVDANLDRGRGFMAQLGAILDVHSKRLQTGRTERLIQVKMMRILLQWVIQQFIPMFDMLLGTKAPQASTHFLNALDTSIKNNQSFLRTVEKWRNLQISYIGKLAELMSECTDRDRRSSSKADQQLQAVLINLQAHHKNFVNKFNHDVFMVDFAESEKNIHEQRGILENERLLHKDLLSKREILEKVRTKKIRLKKSLEEELTLHVFSHDSIEATMDKKVKRFNKMKQLEKEQDEYELKVKQTKQIFDQIIVRAKQNLKKYNQIQKSLIEHRFSMVSKIQMHLLTYAKSLTADCEQLCSNSIKSDGFIAQLEAHALCNQFISEEEEKILSTIRIDQGYLEVTLKIINDKTLDTFIEHSKDREIKKRIKQIIQSNDIVFEETDEFTRQVQIVKKILKGGDAGSYCQYMNFINKGCKFRLNFVFILQLFRLNSQFEILEADLKPIILLVNGLLEKCHENRDAFVLKQTMVLMLTYYVSFSFEGKDQKIYILNFFKKHKFWKDLELWESILIQCIYLQKKATIKMILSTSIVSNKTELAEAEKTSVLNQILYIVRNMVLFDFSEKEVKDFSNKFVKMLKQDDKFLKDVYKSIDTAIKEESENKPPENAAKFIEDITKMVQQV